jgi:hypothetical protein
MATGRDSEACDVTETVDGIPETATTAERSEIANLPARVEKAVQLSVRRFGIPRDLSGLIDIRRLRHRTAQRPEILNAMRRQRRTHGSGENNARRSKCARLNGARPNVDLHRVSPLF